MQQYSFLALAMTKLDQNLEIVRNDIVPDLVDEEEFWRNYFYKIEYIKSSLGLPSALGYKIDWEERERLALEAQRSIYQPAPQFPSAPAGVNIPTDTDEYR